MPDPLGAGVGGAHPRTRRPAGLFALPADRGPVPPGSRLQVQRPELIDAEDHFRIAVLRGRFPVGDGIQLLDPGLLLRVVRVLGGFPGFQALKGGAFLSEQDPQALVADVVYHPLSHHEIGQLGQAPGGERQVMLGRLGLGDLLDLPPLAQRELRRMAALVLRVKGAEPVGVKVADHIADPVLAGEGHLRDRGDVHALSGQQHHLRPPPGHHRPAAPADDPHQPPALIIIDLTHPQPFAHRASLEDQHSRGKPRPGQTKSATALACDSRQPSPRRGIRAWQGYAPRCLTYAPRPGTITTRPSATNTPTALPAVPRATWYCCTSDTSYGSGRSGSSSPDSIRPRRIAASCW